MNIKGNARKNKFKFCSFFFKSHGYLNLHITRRKLQTKGYYKFRSLGFKHLFRLRASSQERLRSEIFFKYAFRLAPTIKKYTMHAYIFFFFVYNQNFH
jgi:hypothetical protein